MKTSLYILFREYSDQAHSPSAFYINGSKETEPEKIVREVNQWLNIIRYFKYEQCNRYYDSENMKGVLYPYTALKEAYEEEEYPDAGYAIRTLLKGEDFVDWRDEPIESEEHYVLNETDVTDDTLGEMARNAIEGNAVVLFNCDAVDYRFPICLCAVSTSQNISIEHYNNIRGLHQWFSENRQPQRIFDYNPKHGDDRHPAQLIAGTNRRAAQLRTNREDTERLLKLAVGTDINSALWYYDEANSCYIYFENQNEIRLAFHGYHLSEGEENYDNIDFRKLRLLSEE